MRSFHLAIRSTILALLLTAVVAASASAASSVAYIDRGSVWLSSLDGTQKVKLMDPVTVSDSTGSWQEPWNDVAQSDGGRIVASRNKPARMSSFSWFQVWEPDGTSAVQGPLNAPSGWTVYVYPLSLDITADGKDLVYGYSNASSCCPIAFGHGTYVRAANSNVVQPIALSGAEHPTLFGSRIVAHSGSTVTVQQVDSGDPYPDLFTPWFASSGTGLAQSRTDVAASGTLVALELEATDVGKIAVLSVQGLDAPVAFPAAVDCFLPASGVAHEASVSQDATRIAWSDADGLKVAGTPTTSADPCVLSSPAVLISATGRHASIGGADVTAFMPKPPPQEPTPPTPDTATPPTTGTPTPQTPPISPTPTTPPTPKAPIAPTIAQIKLTAASTKFAAVQRTGRLPVSLPVRESGIRASVSFRLSAKQAKVFGLKPRRGAATLTIGTGVATSTKSGQVVTVPLRFSRAFLTAFARTVRTNPGVRSVTANLAVNLTRGGLTSIVTKPIRLTR